MKGQGERSREEKRKREAGVRSPWLELVDSAVLAPLVLVARQIAVLTSLAASLQQVASYVRAAIALPSAPVDMSYVFLASPLLSSPLFLYILLSSSVPHGGCCAVRWRTCRQRGATRTCWPARGSCATSWPPPAPPTSRSHRSRSPACGSPRTEVGPPPRARAGAVRGAGAAARGRRWRAAACVLVRARALRPAWCTRTRARRAGRQAGGGGRRGGRPAAVSAAHTARRLERCGGARGCREAC